MKNSLFDQYHDLLVTMDELTTEIDLLPKGYIRQKVIAGNVYHYLQFRDKETVRSKYLPNQEFLSVREQIGKRAELMRKKAALSKEIALMERNLHIHHYRPLKADDLDEYALFMSFVAHEYKRLGKAVFLSKMDTSKYRGIKKKYLKGFIDYIRGGVTSDSRRSNDLILDPYTSQMYFEFGDKEVFAEEIKKAIPAFLNQGLLITRVQEAVS